MTGGIKIGSNVASLTARRQLARVNDDLTTSFQRLSSGLRINTAADDAAGLAIAQSLQVDTRVFNKAIRNVFDGISAINIAEGALTQLTDVTIRIRELAQQAANGTFSSMQRRSLDEEADALTAEFNRILEVTKFNGIKLTDGSASELTIQTGYDSIAMSLGVALGRSIGTGSFTQSATYQVSGYSRSEAADLNRDGKIDLISSMVSDLVGVSIGNGDGTFKAAVTYQTSTVGGSIWNSTYGDFNNDGHVDIIAVSEAEDTVSVLLNNGDGTFKARISSYAADNVRGLDVADINGDGYLDAVGGAYGGNYSQILLGNGNGTFRLGVSMGGGGFGTEFIDINNDGRIDFLAAHDGEVNVHFGTGSGTFSQSFTYNLSSFNLVEVRSGDLNDDGYTDLVVNDAAINRYKILINNGDGTFKVSLSLASSDTLIDVRLTDVNNDGFLDIMGNTSDGDGVADDVIETFFGNGDGTFKGRITSSPVVTPGGGNANMAIGDFNGDGVTDSVVGGKAFLAQKTTTNTIQSFNLHTQAGALSSMSILDQTLERISRELGSLGALQSRLTSANNTLRTASENYSSAQSRIVDVDVASESAALVRHNIRQQAATAVLAQANIQPQLALRLLSN